MKDIIKERQEEKAKEVERILQLATSFKNSEKQKVLQINCF
jgi:hypothetical protein